MENKLKQVEILLQHEDSKKAQELFQNIVSDNSIEYWLVKGKLDQKFQRWGEAINSFLKVLEIDENNTEAQNNLHYIQNIINFWNPEMFNP
jgi:tetratricopeptide (TPR) repeat protein